MQLLRFIIGLVCFLASLTVAGQTIASKDGNIYFRPGSSGNLSRLTETGLDSDPNLSPDGSLVVFVRSTPGKVVESPTGDSVEETELWTVRTDGTQPRLVLRGGVEKGSNDVPVASFSSPQFSPDGTQVYFLSIAAVTSGAVYACNIKTGKLKEVCGANSLLVVRKGHFAGDLVVEQHRYFVGGGSYDWVYVATTDGKEIGPLGDRDDPGFELRLKEVLGGDGK